VFAALHDIPFAVQDLRSGHWNGEDLIPPVRLMRDGHRGREAFVEGGREVVPFYRDVIGIEPGATLLDIGSGIGRKTIPLLDYLDEHGRYIGVDVDPDLVDWCIHHISTKNPRFSFVPVSIHNSFYNPRGALPPDRFVFPFPDDSFDAVVLWSVFTHLYPSTIEHYLAEIHRMLRPGGRIGASFFVLDEMARAEVRAGRSFYPVTHEMDGYWTSNPTMPEDLIAVDHDWLLGALDRAGFSVDELRLGSWSNHPVDAAYAGLNVQDVVVATVS
jgi:SAM-dependent methyltransferase